MMPQIQYPITDVHLVLRACNASEPLKPGDRRWYNFTDLRHTRVLDRLQRVFAGLPASGEFHHRVLCGHRGCGKSTELLRFKSWADQEGFACARIEVDVRLGHVGLEFSDFFLLAATAAEETLAELGSPLPEESIRPIVEWFAEVTKVERDHHESELAIEAEAQIGGKLPFGLGKLAAKFMSGIKAGASHAVTVRRQMRNYPDRLINLTGDLLQQANQQMLDLPSPRERGLILLFDNLDRYDPDQIDRVLMVGSNLLQRLGCHALFTIPIELEYNPRSGPLRDAYGQPVVLPMVPLRRPDDPWRATVTETRHEQDAIRGMRAAIEQRLEIESIFESPCDVDLMIQMSGGCIRDLMHLVALSFEMSDGDVLSSRGVETAVRELRATYARELSRDDYERLADIADRHPVLRDEQTLRLLFNRWALEYYDSHGKVWLDVHPLVIEIHEFQDAYRQRQLTTGD